jgi:hypothetical protein
VHNFLLSSAEKIRRNSPANKQKKVRSPWEQRLDHTFSVFSNHKNKKL